MLDHSLLLTLYRCCLAGLFLAILVEYLIFRHGLTLMRVRRLLLLDGVAALAFFTLFATGCLLVLEQVNSLDQLFSHPGYEIRVVLFLLMAGSLYYPNRLFYRWRRSLRQERAPMISIQQQFRVVWILRGNLVLIALLILLTKLAPL